MKVGHLNETLMMKTSKESGLGGTVTPVPSVSMSMPDLATVVVNQMLVVENGMLKAQEAPTTVDMEANVDVASSLMPQNWSNRRKWLILIILSLTSLMVNMSLVICTPASSVIAQQFNNYDSFLSVFFITVPNLGQVIGPLYIGPLSERFGRVLVCHFFNLMFLVFTMITGFSNSLAMVIVFRFLAGASVASICLNPAITGDLFAVKKRGAAMSLTSMIPILGSAVGPIIGGYVTQYLSWRWTFWLMAIATSCLSLLMVAVLKESYVPLIQRRALRKSGSGLGSVSSPSKYLTGWNLTTFKSISLLTVRPFVILSSSRIAVLMALYLSILFGYVSLLVATTASVFQDVYGLSESHSGLIYIALTIGTLSGALMCTFTLDYFLIRGISRKTPDDCTTLCPENRLIPIIPAMVIFPVGLLLYGWSLHFRYHWIVPTVATVLCGFSLSSSTTPIMNYIVDIFGERSASAVAAVLPLRYVAGAFLPVAAPYMYSTLGYGWGNSLLAFVLLAAVPVPLLVIVQPERMKPLTKSSG
ncbi:Major facilitator superfamily domain, general substrate transporter [Penicillium expansum]|uniref:Major facilitator superfamily domain, general substrate transporter n=1 Tax=Penicillium expansum TaxID=27334 RepID=A0A0A2JDP5_PENEN|nr:Major facilitator superfamily domain, general substrate transporter [Penicillium expansum]KGO52911.1 Major facilitator superfamily domain, general substrate transporter [Penicillium expansum]